MKIPLRNRKKEIITYTTVSSEHYEHLNQFKWGKSKYYVGSTINTNTWLLHRYIKLEIMKEVIPKGYVIDYKDNNSLNNHHDNLRFASRSENAQNKKKKENCSSKFVGVSKKNKRFQVSININKKRLTALYDDEIHATHQYNLYGLMNII